MKKLLITMSFVLLVFNLNAQVLQSNTPQKSGEAFPEIKFETPKHDFGTLNEGDVVTYVYKFTNIGKVPLIISRMKASCGCTVPSNWKKEPIMPGEKSEFTVRFNTRNKIHKQHKTVTIFCNTKKKTERVYFTANVIPDPKMEKQRAERRKKWAEQRKKNQQKRNKTNQKRRMPKLDFAAKDQIKSNEISIKKLEVKLLKQEQKLERKIHKGNLSKEKVKKYQDKIKVLKDKINKFQSANKKIRYGK